MRTFRAEHPARSLAAAPLRWAACLASNRRASPPLFAPRCTAFPAAEAVEPLETALDGGATVGTAAEAAQPPPKGPVAAFSVLRLVAGGDAGLVQLITAVFNGLHDAAVRCFWTGQPRA